MCVNTSSISISLIPIKGIIIPPIPYITMFNASTRLGEIGRYFTPFRASGIRAIIIRALNITALKIALSGVGQFHNIEDA